MVFSNYIILFRNKVFFLNAFNVTSGLVTVGLWGGYCIGDNYKKQVDICGGIIILSIGIKIICNYFNIL